MKVLMGPALAASVLFVGAAGAFAATAAAPATTAPAATAAPANPTPAATAQAAPAGKLLTEEQVMQKLRADGYTKVTDLKKEAAGSTYDAKAITKDGKTVSLNIDGKTGAVKAQ